MYDTPFGNLPQDPLPFGNAIKWSDTRKLEKSALFRVCHLEISAFFAFSYLEISALFRNFYLEKTALYDMIPFEGGELVVQKESHGTFEGVEE